MPAPAMPAPAVPALVRTEPVPEGQGLPWWRERSPRPVIFHDDEEEPLPEGVDEELLLPMLFHPRVNGLADERDLELAPGAQLAARYCVQRLVGKGGFADAYLCTRDGRGMGGGAALSDVCLKVVRSQPESVLGSVDEVRVLKLLRAADPLGARAVQRLVDFFFFKEHLVIVTTYAGESLRAFYRTSGDERRHAFFLRDGGLASLTVQLADALSLLHQHDIAHADVKPENVCVAVAGASPLFTLIDFGSTVFRHAAHNSYVQSRWYRAPEVMLGASWGVGVDVWSLGCVLAEVLLGAPLFKAGSVERVLASHVAVLGPLPSSLLNRASEVVRMDEALNAALYDADAAGGLVRLYPRANRLDQLLPPAAVAQPTLLELLKGMLALDPTERVTALEVRWHRFLDGRDPPPRACERDDGFAPVARLDADEACVDGSQ